MVETEISYKYNERYESSGIIMIHHNNHGGDTW